MYEALQLTTTISLNPVITRFLSNSQPIPPAPTIRIFEFLTNSERFSGIPSTAAMVFN